MECVAAFTTRPPLVHLAPASSAQVTNRVWNRYPLAQEVKYLGAYVDDTSADNKHLRYRILQAVAASKSPRQLTGPNVLPPSWKLRVYKAVSNTIYSPLYCGKRRFDACSIDSFDLGSIRYKNLRRIFKIKSSYYHKVIEPSDALCSNEYLHELAYKSGRAVPPSRLYSQNRLKLMGHILRHSDTLESQVVFSSTHACRSPLGGLMPHRGITSTAVHTIGSPPF